MIVRLVIFIDRKSDMRPTSCPTSTPPPPFFPFTIKERRRKQSNHQCILNLNSLFFAFHVKKKGCESQNLLSSPFFETILWFCIVLHSNNRFVIFAILNISFSFTKIHRFLGILERFCQAPSLMAAPRRSCSSFVGEVK